MLYSRFFFSVTVTSSQSGADLQEASVEIGDVDDFGNEASLLESADEEFVPSDDCESDDSDNSECQNYEETGNVDLKSGNFFLCDLLKIIDLVKFCPSCGNPVEDIKTTTRGSMLILLLNCLKNCGVKWCSQDMWKNSKIPMGNVMLTCATFPNNKVTFRNVPFHPNRFPRNVP